MVKLYIVRHCEAQANALDIFQGHLDGDITEKGEKQLDCLSERFRGVPVDAIYSSPLIRAYKTAQAVNKYHGLEITKDDRLKEIYGGKAEGKTHAEVSRLFPKEDLCWKEDFANYRAPEGESFREVYERAVEALNEIVAENDGKVVVMALHGGTIRCLTAYLYGLPADRMAEVGWHDNTGVSLYEIDGKEVGVVYFNDVSHIADNPETAPQQMPCCIIE